MKIPKYWASERQQVKDTDGREIELKCWRWSEENVAAAQQSAREHLATVARTLHSADELPRYSYGEHPLREEIIKTFNPERIITRNAYGALVLNTARVMFVDIDLKAAKASGGVLSLFGKPAPDATAEARTKIEAWMKRHPGWGLRVYRTQGGLRGLVTHDLFTPESNEAQAVLKELESDPLYVTLCRAQKCFRARLTPKHWRCDLPKPPARYPFENPKDEQRHQQWVQRYEAATRNYGVCEFVVELGNLNRHPEAEAVMTVHDEYALRAGKLA